MRIPCTTIHSKSGSAMVGASGIPLVSKREKKSGNGSSSRCQKKPEKSQGVIITGGKELEHQGLSSEINLNEVHCSAQGGRSEHNTVIAEV